MNKTSYPKRPSRLLAGCALALACALPTMAQACSTDPIIGSVCAYSFNWCPPGYLRADGSLVSNRQYIALFSLIGYKYGGDQSTTFALPDLRGRMTVGTGTSPSPAAPAPVAIAQKVGQQQVTLNAAQVPIPTHIHQATFTPATSPTQVKFPATPDSLGVQAALPLGTTLDGAPVPALNGTINLAALAAKTSTGAAMTIKGPYTTTQPATTAATLQAKMTVDGAAATPAVSTTVTALTGGTVTIGPNAPQSASAPVNTQSPGLGTTMCIAYNGNYPPRP